MTTMTIRIPEEEKELIRAYANIHGMSIAEVLRTSAMQRIEDEFDLKDLDAALAASDGSVYTLKEVKARYGL